jgi:hypothetical protein
MLCSDTLGLPISKVDVVIYQLTLSSIYRKDFLTYLRSVRLLWGLSAVRSDASVPGQLGELDRTGKCKSTPAWRQSQVEPVSAKRLRFLLVARGWMRLILSGTGSWRAEAVIEVLGSPVKIAIWPLRLASYFAAGFPQRNPKTASSLLSANRGEVLDVSEAPGHTIMARS